MNTVSEPLQGWEVTQDYLELRRSKPDSKIRFCTTSAIVCFFGSILFAYLSVLVISVVLASAMILILAYIANLNAGRPCKANQLVEPEDLSHFPSESIVWLNSLAAKAVGPLKYGDIDRAIMDCAAVASTNRCAARSDEFLRKQRTMLEDMANYNRS